MISPNDRPRIALVHDFLYTYAGAERVLEQMIKLFPDAEVFSLFDFVPDDERAFLQGKKVTSSFIQKLPFARKRHRHYLPLMPLAVEQMDVSGFDIVLSSSYVAAKGVVTGPRQLHICYCHTPCRFAWDLQHQYLSESRMTSGLKSLLARIILHYFRTWDARSANGVESFIANSDYIARRIAKVYRRESETIYPPVAIDDFPMQPHKEDFYLTVSRLVPYKKVPTIVEAFSRMPNRRLMVVGTGPEMKRVKELATPNIQILGYQPYERLRRCMQFAKAFVYAAEEDFGIVPVEAQACGTPVIAYGGGGVLETVSDGQSGVLYPQQTPESIIMAVERFEREGLAWTPEQIAKNVERFGADRFREELGAHVTSAWQSFRRQSQPHAANRDAGIRSALPASAS